MKSVVLPAALPAIFAGIRLAITTSLIVLVMVEIIAGNNGLGYLLQEARENLNVAVMFAILFTLGILGYALDAGVRFIAIIVMPWRRGQDYFVPELLLCSDALYAGLDILQPHEKNNRLSTSSGKIILGVVEGDIHDIGKNLLKAIFTATGWKVHDLGKDVTCRTFTEAQQAISARRGIWRSVSKPSGSVVGRAAVRVFANIADYPFICRFQPA